jgi:3-isopropylmalate/(R)-2-methylmalate dehydratase small subunit
MILKGRAKVISGNLSNGAPEPDNEGTILVFRNIEFSESFEEQVNGLRQRGITGIIAADFAREFYRSAINVGLPTIKANISDNIEDGDDLEIDLTKGKITFPGGTVNFSAVSEIIAGILNNGGLMPYIKKYISSK